MTKTFTCLELGGICDERVSGTTFSDIIQKGMQHMQSDKAHMDHMMNMSQSTGETKDEWFQRMQKEFDARPEDTQ